MTDKEEDTLLCPTCANEVDGTDDFCPRCGEIFADDVFCQIAKSCLEQAGLHPMLFCRRQPKGGPRFVYTLYEAGGDYDGHIVNEIKVLVPCQEVLPAEEVLRSLELLKTKRPA